MIVSCQRYLLKKSWSKTLSLPLIVSLIRVEGDRIFAGVSLCLACPGAWSSSGYQSALIKWGVRNTALNIRVREKVQCPQCLWESMAHTNYPLLNWLSHSARNEWFSLASLPPSQYPPPPPPLTFYHLCFGRLINLMEISRIRFQQGCPDVYNLICDDKSEGTRWWNSVIFNPLENWRGYQSFPRAWQTDILEN